MSDDTGPLTGLDAHIARSRQAKATHLMVWLEHADPWCRSCAVPIRQNTYEEWVDADLRSRFCLVPAFKGKRMEHRPDPWTPARVARASDAERKRIAGLAGTKPPSAETWAVVVELYTAMYARRHPAGL